MITIAVSVKEDSARVALLKNDSLAEYTIWRFNEPGEVGDLYCGRITSCLPAMAGSFVDLGGTTGFLPDSAGAAGLTEGCCLAVEITRSAQSGKGPRLAAQGHGLGQETGRKPGLIRASLGPLRDLALRYPDAAIAIDDYGLIATLSSRCKGDRAGEPAIKATYKTVAFDTVLEDEIAALAEPVAQLDAGARMHITPTPALTAIDIDAGAASADKSSKQHAQLSLNTALIPEIARQILLRNLSGAILIDFAGMKSSARPKLLPALQQALQADPLHPRCLGFSHLGFAEITRPRFRPPLHEFLS